MEGRFLLNPNYFYFIITSVGGLGDIITVMEVSENESVLSYKYTASSHLFIILCHLFLYFSNKFHIGHTRKMKKQWLKNVNGRKALTVTLEEASFQNLF